MFCVGVYVRVHGLCCAVPRDASGDPSRILDDGKMCIRTCVRVCAIALCCKTLHQPFYVSCTYVECCHYISPFLLKSSFVIFFSSLTMARSRSRSRTRSPVPPPASSLPAIARARQIVATQKKVVTFYADGTSKVVVCPKRKVCKKWVGFSGNARRKKCYASRSKWTEGMCRFHAAMIGCRPPQKKPKTLRNGPAESDACKIRDDDKIGLEGVVVKDDE